MSNNLFYIKTNKKELTATLNPQFWEKFWRWEDFQSYCKFKFILNCYLNLF